jgi:chitinase
MTVLSASMGCAVAQAQTTGFGKQKVIGYYLPNSEFPVSALDASKVKKLTHIHYAFVTVVNGQLRFLADDTNAPQNVRQLVELKKDNPNLKICASMGGWTETNTDERAKNNRRHYEAAMATDSSRAAFAANVRAFMASTGFDCFDIDMEHPGWDNQTGPSGSGFQEAYNFGKLLEALKKEFAGRYELSIASAGSFWFLQFHYPFIEWWAQNLDSLNTMTYDLSGSWDRFTGHNANLYGSRTPTPAAAGGYYNFMRDASYINVGWGNLVRQAPGSGNGRFPNYPLSVDTLVKELVALGVPRSKIVLGVPFYGRAFKGVPAMNNGLFQSHTTEGGDPYTGDPSWIVGCDRCLKDNEPRFVTYADVKNMLANSSLGYQVFRDPDAMVPYLYNASRGVYVTYDDVTSIKQKGAYILENGLGGGMFWHLGQDTMDGELLGAFHSVLNGTPGEADQFATRNSQGVRYTPWLPTPETFSAGKTYSYNAVVVDAANNVWRAESPQAGAQPNASTGWVLLGVSKNEGIAFHSLQVAKLGTGDMNGMKVELPTSSAPPAVNPSPVTPSPVTPSPVAPSPVAPSPVAPSPVAPSPVAPSPVAPSPVAPSPVAPSPVAPSPVAPSPMNPAASNWISGTPYKAGQLARGSNGTVYQCKPWPYEGWCTSHDPAGIYGSQAWDVASSVPAQPGSAAAPLWVNGTQYRAGQQVTGFNGSIYQCKPWPYEGWCAGLDPVGIYGSQAWELAKASVAQPPANSNPAPSPVTPSPVTPSPVTPSPVTPSPLVPSPSPIPGPTPAPVAAMPTKPTIAWTSPTASPNESRKLTWNMYWGQRAEKWRIHVNGQPGADITSFDSTGPLTQAGAQAGSFTHVFQANTQLEVELCNGNNCVKSDAVNIALQRSAGAPPSPSTPVPLPSPSQPAANPAYPCAGTVPGKVETVTAACLAKLEEIQFGGEKLVPGKLGHIPLAANGKPAKEAYGYFVEWSQYGRKFNVSHINAAQYSKVLFSFLRLMPDGSLKITDEWATLQASNGMSASADGKANLFDYTQPEKDRGIMLALTYLKARHPHLKTSFSVGGWTLSGQFSSVMANPQTRAAFVRNVLNFANQYGFDGVDIDWEYPVVGGNTDAAMAGVNYVEVNRGSPSDAINFVLMLKELREAVNAEAMVNPRTKTGKKEISTAVGLNPKTIDALDFSQFIPFIDTVNLMSYDFNGGWSSVASHNAPLYNNQGSAAVAKGGDQLHSEFNNYDAVLNILWNASGRKGMRKSASVTQAQREAVLSSPVAQQVLPKLILGLAYYGRSWSTSEAMPQSTAYTPWFKGGAATGGSFENGVWDTADVIYVRDNKQGLMTARGRQVSAAVTSARFMGEAWDQFACANLAWINVGGSTQLVSYNDEDSLQHMARFVTDQGMAGTMVWEMDGDTHGEGSYRLSRAVMHGFAKQPNNIDGKPLKTCVKGGRE